MSFATSPYLSILRTLLATTLRPRENESAEKVAMYMHRMLTQLLLLDQLLPELQRKSLVALSDLLEPLGAELRSVDGGSSLIAALDAHVRQKPDFAAAEPVVQSAVKLLANHLNPARKKLMKQVSAIILNVQDEFHRAAVSQEMPPPAGDKPIEPLSTEQKIAFQQYLRKKFPQDAALDVGSLKAVLGGGSKKTIFVDLRNATTLPDTIVLRVDKADSPVGSTVADEFDIIKLMFESGLPVPQPFALETDASIVGASLRN